MTTIDSTILGPVRRWREGDIFMAENKFVYMAYVVIDDQSKIGGIGWHNGVCVEYIDAKTAELWN